MNTGDPVNAGTRRHHAPRRDAAAAQTREAILNAAKEQFEARGWAATTVAAVAAVDYAIASDVAEVPVNARESARSVESAPDAATMLDRHASHVAAINARSAGLAQEQAERDFVIAMDWGTHRTLTGELGLAPGQLRDWIHSYYQRMFLSQAQDTPPS